MILSTTLLVLAGVTCAASVVVVVELVLGARRLPFLRDEAPVATGMTVSVIVAARNEAPHIAHALVSLLSQGYDSYEVIAVDDRSTDATGDILDRMASDCPRLRVLHITELPPGWLGKNHALHRAAAMATGEVLLFTDADVVFDPTVVGRTAACMTRLSLDHLTLGPELDIPTLPLALVVNFFTLWFLLYFKPWLAARSSSPRYLGIGAFNAVRASMYRRIGGHERIAMRPDDDIKLGKLVKRSGGRQLVGMGIGMIRVRWYASLRELVAGFQKNAFAALEYSGLLVVGSMAVLLIVNVWPFVALLFVAGPTWWLNAIAAALLMTMYALVAAASRNRPWLAPLYPAATIIFMYIIASATIRTLRRGGIEWRGTVYPLSALRKNIV